MYTPRVKKKSQAVKSTKDCHICFENFRVEDLQSFHLEHSLHLACRDCRKPYLDSLASAVVTCPYSRLPLVFCTSENLQLIGCK